MIFFKLEVVFYLVCQLILHITAGDLASCLIDNPLPLIDLAEEEVPRVVLHQLPGLPALGDGGVRPRVPGQPAAHHPAHAVTETRSEAVASRGVAGGA